MLLPRFPVLPVEFVPAFWPEVELQFEVLEWSW